MKFSLNNFLRLHQESSISGKLVSTVIRYTSSDVPSTVNLIKSILENGSPVNIDVTKANDRKVTIQLTQTVPKAAKPKTLYIPAALYDLSW